MKRKIRKNNESLYPKGRSWIDEYRSRVYVRGTNFGMVLFAAGIFFKLSFIGLIIWFCSGLSHWIDSRQRIRKLKAKLRR